MRAYSARGGTVGYTVRLTIPSRSSARSVLVSMRRLRPSTARSQLVEPAAALGEQRDDHRPEVLTDMRVTTGAVAAGTLFSNAGAGRVGYLTRDDSAAVAAAVLAGGGSEGQILEVTGPAAVSDAELADALAEATGRPVAWREVDDEELVSALAGQGVPEPVAHAWSMTGPWRRDGWFDVTTHAAERLTGQRPASLTKFFAAHRAELLAG